MSTLSNLTIPAYRLDEGTGRGVATFSDRSIEFGDYSDPQSVAAYDQTLSAWLSNGRRLPSPDELAGRPAATGAIPWAQYEAELLELYHPLLKSKATRIGMVHALGVLKSLGVTSTADLTTSLIARLVTTRDPRLSPNTVRGLLRYVQTVASHAYKCGYLKISPFAIRPLRTWVRPSPPKGVKHLSKIQIRSILDLLAKEVDERQGFSQWRSRRLEALVSVVAYCGLRKAEALYLKVEDIDFTAGLIYVVDRAEHRTKTEKSAAPVPIPDGLRQPLQSWLDHRLDAPPALLRPLNPWVFCNIMQPTPWTGGAPGSRALCRFKQLALRAGVEQASFQMLRRSLATHLEAAGAGEAMIMRLLRHSNVEVGRKFYRRADEDNMRAAVDGFSY